MSLTAVAIFAAAAVFIVSGTGGRSCVRTVDDVAQALAAALAAVAAARASRHHGGRSGRGWAIMAFGVGMWAAGQLVWCWYEIVEGVPAPFPSTADIGYLSFSVAATVAVGPIGNDLRRGGRARAVLDGLVVAGALLVISWSTALGATVRAGDGLTFGLAVAVAYPVSDIVLLTLTVQMLTRTSAVRGALLTLGAATISLALADSSFTYLSSIGRYHTGDPLDLGWIGGFGLIAVAASAARPRPAASPAPTRQLVFLPYAVLVAASAVMVALFAAGHRIDIVEVVLAATVVVLVLARQYLAVRDNQELLRTVEAREAELAHQAFHDHLTGLPNRALFNDRVGHALELHQTHRHPLAVLFCDLDDFKVINDTLGHLAGDNLLVRVAERLRGAVRPSDTLARLGGDEFAILVEGADPAELGERIIAALREPFLLDGRPTSVHASIGISLVGGDVTTPPAALVLANADTAMYAVKRAGKAGSLVYDDSLRSSGLDDLDLRQALTEALLTGGVHPVFQPIVDPVNGRVHALETLARWQHDGRPVSPVVFVTVAEHLGLVSLLTDAMLDSGVGQLARWSDMLGHHDLRVSVNVSAYELGDGRLVERVTDVLSRHPVRSTQLILEITESAVTTDAKAAARVLRQLRDIGVHVALDDFGTGHSSLSRLQELPIDYLKLDGAMIADLTTDTTQALVARSMIELGRALDMRVTAEGIETMAQVELLQATRHPPLMQGYALAPPAPAEALTALPRHRSSTASGSAHPRPDPFVRRETQPSRSCGPASGRTSVPSTSAANPPARKSSGPAREPPPAPRPGPPSPILDRPGS